MSIPQELRVDQASYSKTIQLVNDSYQQDVPGLDMENYIMNNDNEESYFSDPYENRYSAWVPPIVVDRLIAFPNQLICSKSDLNQFSGLFPEIGYYYLVNGNRMFLWSYMKKHDLMLPEDLNQQITHVLLANVVKDVFDPSVTHILVVTTRIEIVAYPISANASKGISIQGNPLRQSTNNLHILCLTSTRSGRIFFGCEDNDIYEFDYRYNSNFFLQLMGYSSRGQVVNRTGYLIQLIVPSFIREISFGNNINKLIVDDDRHMLYCLYKHNMIYGYYLGEKDSQFDCVLTVSNVHHDLRQYCNRSSQRECTNLLPALSNPENQGISLVSLSIIPKAVAERISVVAVTKSNLRLYYSVNSVNGKSPTSMTLTAVRFPPAHSVPIRSGLQFYSTYFTINEDNSVTAYSRDYLHHLRKDIDTYQTPNGDRIESGQISNIETLRYQETCRLIKERGYDTVNVYAIEDKPNYCIPSAILSRLNNGLVLPYLSLNHRYLILTSNSIMVLNEVSMIDQLVHLLSVDQWENEMKLYYKYFNTFEACYNLLICLTQSKASNLHNRIVNIITEKAGVPNYTVNNRFNNTMVLNKKDTRSHLYEGLIKAISRGLLLLWNEPIVNKDCSQLRYPQTLLASIVQFFNNLVHFLVEVYRDGLSANAVMYPGNEAKQEEMKDVRLLYWMLLRSIQILRLFIYVDTVGVQAICHLLIPSTQSGLSSITFSNLINSSEGCGIIKQLINAILVYYKQNPIAVVYEVCDTLSSFCGGYFTLGEKLYNQGMILLNRILEDAYHVDEREMQNAIDSIVLSFKYFNASDLPLHARDVYTVLTQSGRFVEYTRFAIRAAGILSPEFFEGDTLESSKTALYQTVVDTMKLLMSGRRDQVKVQNNRETLMNSMLNECIRSSQKSLCFLVFQWLLDNHIYDVLLNTQSELMEQFLHEHSPDLLHRYYLKNRNYMKAAEVMFVSAFKNDNETPIDHRLQYLTSCINNLNAASTGLTQQAVPLPGMNLSQLGVTQQNMRLQASVAESVLQMEGAEANDIKILQYSVMDSTDLYRMAQKYHFDTICLQILRNSNYTDETVILTHWKNIINSISQSDNHNKMEVIKTKVIHLAKEFYNTSSPLFFPLPYLFEIVLSAGALECQQPANLYKWFIHCFVECGVPYEHIIKTAGELIDLKPTSKWRVTVIGVFVEAVDAWTQFIILKNIDPVMKTRFAHSIDYLVGELNKMKERMKEIRDGSISQNIADCDKQIDKVLKELLNQKDRERSFIYGNMM